jgi:hypothetical protein
LTTTTALNPAFKVVVLVSPDSNDLLQKLSQIPHNNITNKMVIKWTDAADAALAVAFLRVFEAETIMPARHKDTILNTLKEFGFIENWESVRSVTVPFFLAFLSVPVPSVCFRHFYCATPSTIIHPLPTSNNFQSIQYSSPDTIPFSKTISLAPLLTMGANNTWTPAAQRDLMIAIVKRSTFKTADMHDLEAEMAAKGHKMSWDAIR